MKAAILGLPGAGRKTLMAALGIDVEPQSLAGKRTVSTIRVPDERVDRLSESFRPEKTTWATVEMVLDDSSADSLARRLQAVRNHEVLVLVAGAFGLGEDSAQSALDDLDRLMTEMLLADLMIVEKRVDFFARRSEKGQEPRLFDRINAALNEGRHLRELPLIDAEMKLLAPYSFLTLKPVLAVLNIDEEELANPAWTDVRARVRAKGADPVVLCALLERDVASLPHEEQLEFIRELGMESPASHRLVQAIYSSLDLISFFTVGEDEVKAWTTRRGDPAPIAGGRIHSDIQRGFIRAEVVSYDDFILTGSQAAARKTGRLRTEGKTYVVKDGDIANFLFNV